jgi:SAM-dependent methyltransferase
MYNSQKMLSNTAKYMINDAIASVPGKKLLIEAEYCQGVAIGIQRGMDPTDYYIMGNKQETYDNALEFGAHAYLGWSRDILPTFEDNSFDLIYMDYCCSPSGNTDCRPLEEMKEVHRILKPGGKALFTFCKRSSRKGQKNMKLAKKSIQYHFAWVDTVEYKVDGNQPMFVVLCTKSWFEPFRAKHEAFNGKLNADTISPPPSGTFEHWPTMCMCDICGSLYPDGVECKRSENQFWCKECVLQGRHIYACNVMEKLHTAAEEHCQRIEQDIQTVETSLSTIPDILKDVVGEKLSTLQTNLQTAQTKLTETTNALKSNKRKRVSEYETRKRTKTGDTHETIWVVKKNIGIRLANIGNGLFVHNVCPSNNTFHHNDEIILLNGEYVRYLDVKIFARKLEQTPRPCTIQVIRSSQNSLSQFIETCCERDENAFVKRVTFQKKYVSWCEQNNKHIINRTYIRTHVYEKYNISLRKSVVWKLFGIRLK